MSNPTTPTVPITDCTMEPGSTFVYGQSAPTPTLAERLRAYVDACDGVGVANQKRKEVANALLKTRAVHWSLLEVTAYLAGHDAATAEINAAADVHVASLRAENQNLTERIAELETGVRNLTAVESSAAYSAIAAKSRAAQPAGRNFAAMKAWLVREMPSGTIIHDPIWWADRIARMFAGTPQAVNDGE